MNIKKIIRYVFAEDEDFPLEDRLFLSSLFVGILTSIAGTIANAILITAWPAVILPLILSLLLFVLYYFVRVKRIIEPFKFPIIVIALIGISFIWVFNGGINGSNVMPAFVILILGLIVFPDKTKKYVLLLFITLNVLIYLIQLLRPDLIVNYQSETERWIDSLFTLMYTSSFIFLIIKFLHKNYTFERIKSVESENKYRELIENSPDAIAIYVEGKIVYVNNESVRLMRVKNASELLGKPILQFIHPDYHASILERMQKVTEKGVVLPLTEEKFVRPDGSVVDVEVKAMPIRYEEKPAVQLIVRDISDRMEAEEALRWSEALHTAIFNASPDATLVADMNGKYLMVSPTALAISGRTSDADILGHTYTEFLAPEDKELAFSHLSQMLQGVKTGPNQYHVLRPDGTLVDVEVNGSFILDTEGKPIQIVFIIRDISARKQIEAALHESEEKYREMADLLPQIIFETDTFGLLTYINKQGLKILGFPADYPIKNINTLDYHTSESKQRAVENIKQNIADKTELKSNTYTLIRRDGTTFEALVYSNAIIKDNKPVGLRGIIVDISEHKRAEEELKASEKKFRELFEANSDGITIFRINPETDGPPTKIIDLNENAAKMLGYTKTEMLLMTPTEFEIDASKEKIDKRMQNLQSRGSTDFEMNIRHKNGQVINAEVKVILINYNNQPALMNIVRDITERKNNEIQLQKYAIELRKQIAEKDKFFSIISHDLRSPLSGLMGLTEILVDGLPVMAPDNIQKIALDIQVSTSNLYRLLGNLLEWSSMQRGLTSFSQAILLLKPKVDEAVVLIKEAVSKKNIFINNLCPDTIEVYADKNMLGGIFRNIISNAAKFTPKSGTITISAKLTTDNHVEISVNDTGIGMNSTILDNLFNLEINTNRKGIEGEPSTGLGLILCKDFIEKHGGKLWIESEEGKGSTFYFTLPVAGN